MIVYRCDRCKKILPNDWQKYNIERNSTVFIELLDEDEKTVHLCQKCTQLFEDFLEGKRVDAQSFGTHTEDVYIDEFLI